MPAPAVVPPAVVPPEVVPPDVVPPADVTLRVATPLVTVPWLLLAMQRTRRPESASAAAARVDTAAVAPGVSAKPAAPGAWACQRYAGGGDPAASTVKVAAAPATTLTSAGCWVMAGTA